MCSSSSSIHGCKGLASSREQQAGEMHTCQWHPKHLLALLPCRPKQRDCDHIKSPCVPKTHSASAHLMSVAAALLVTHLVRVHTLSTTHTVASSRQLRRLLCTQGTPATRSACLSSQHVVPARMHKAHAQVSLHSQAGAWHVAPSDRSCSGPIRAM